VHSDAVAFHPSMRLSNSVTYKVMDHASEWSTFLMEVDKQMRALVFGITFVIDESN
jgi:hypothetical protein